MIRYIRESWDMASTKAKILATMGIALSLLMFVVIIWLSKNWAGETAERDPGDQLVEVAPVKPVAETLLELGYSLPMGVAERSILDQHFAALGGFDAISSVSSLRFSGKVTFANGNVQDVVVVKKGGDRMRISVSNKFSQTSVCLSPSDNWRAVWHNQELVEVEDLPPEDVKSQRYYIYAVSELFLAMGKGWDLSYLGVRDFNYKMAYVFEVRPDPRHYVRIFIDPESFLDIGREDMIFEPDGTLAITRRHNSEHFQAGALFIPGRVEVFKDGELTQVLKIESGMVNPGILETAFVRPKKPVTP